MSSKKTKGAKKRVQRATSNVFAMFDEAQIREFKEAFNIIDQNRDGFIDRDDLREMYANLGKDISDEELDKMLADAPGPINFTMYLTLFGEHLNGTDPEDVIKNAFACMDLDNNGYITEENFKYYLTTMGDRFTPDEMDLALQLAPHDAAGNILYSKYARAITRGNEEEAAD